MSHSTHHAIDGLAVGVLCAVLMKFLPPATTILVFVVAVIRFFETATVRAALKRLKVWHSG